MSTVYAQLVGDCAVLRREDLERLLQLARRVEPVDVQTQDGDVPSVGIMQVCQDGGAFDWLADEEDLYSVADLKVRYR